MAIRELPGHATTDWELDWDVVAERDGWSVQVHGPELRGRDRFLFWRDWNPVRLVSPDGAPWASAGTVDELVSQLPRLLAKFSSGGPVLTPSDWATVARALASEARRAFPDAEG